MTNTVSDFGIEMKTDAKCWAADKPGAFGKVIDFHCVMKIDA